MALFTGEPGVHLGVEMEFGLRYSLIQSDLQAAIALSWEALRIECRLQSDEAYL
jgi:hypothetical protein